MQIYDRLEAELRDEFGEEVTRDELRLIVSARMKDMAERDAASMVTAAGGEVNVQSVAAKMNELQQNSSQSPPHSLLSLSHTRMHTHTKIHAHKYSLARSLTHSLTRSFSSILLFSALFLEALIAWGLTQMFCERDLIWVQCGGKNLQTSGTLVRCTPERSCWPCWRPVAFLSSRRTDV